MGHHDQRRAVQAIGLLDLTELGDDATVDDVHQLCHRALGPVATVAAVCVWPRHVATARQLLVGTSVRVATVVNFPNGTEPLPDVLRAVAQALLDGTDEIDLVLPYRALAAGDLDEPVHMIRAVRSAMPGILKIILETGELANPLLIEQAAHIAIEHGADFIKTSTGRTRVGATLSATALMLDVIRRTNRPVGLKPSGGIRTFDEAMAYIDQAESVMGAGWPTTSTFRFGASSLLNAFEAAATDSVRTESSNDGY